MQRRQFLRTAGTTLAVASTAGLAACARQPVSSAPGSGTVVSSPHASDAVSMAELAPIRAQTDRITGVYVCTPFNQPHPSEVTDEPDYGDLRDRIREITPRTVDMPPGGTPFPQPYVHRYTTMMFNVSTYARMLMSDFLTAGGKIEVREFRSRK